MVLLACAVLVLTACEPGSTGPARVVRANGTPAIEDALSPPGTPLGDEFSVPPGASLVGAVLPESLETGYPGLSYQRAWLALLLVRDDGPAVAQDLLEQAAARGMHTAMAVSCLAPNPCMAGAEAPEKVGEYGVARRALRMEFAARASLLQVTFMDLDPDADDPPVRATPAAAVDAEAFPHERVELPRPGSDLLLSRDGRGIRVKPGSEPLVPSFCDACYGTDLVLMRAGDGEAVWKAYAETLREWDWWEGPGRCRSEERDGWRVRICGFSDSRRGVNLYLYEKEDSPSYLRLNITNGG